MIRPYPDSGPLPSVPMSGCPISPNDWVIILNFLNQIRKKRQQGGVYNPQEMENKDYKRKGNIDINSISMQVQPERLI